MSPEAQLGTRAHTQPPDELLTLGVVAVETGATYHWLDRRANANKIPVTIVGRNRCVRRGDLHLVRDLHRVDPPKRKMFGRGRS